ncbi:Pseudouridine synthase, catalytic domain-containing protein [Cynara cardunculus var. scolymus]|uniref:Pseudouridine synthase, catalytic domain-containing protein n=1 Tax=Cynara cardunculus var. scolymus TaxID=59895 RepID=A0A124SCL1_CYNCS|nr:Pseudouridine synthase, catalytic domain-containing protein [Cynara cardunculus var. scolymus]
MATSTPLFTISPLIHRQTSSSSKLFVTNPNYKTKIITILCSSSSSYPQSTTILETLAPPPLILSVNDTTPERWVPHRKRKVVMRVGYAGIDFRATKKDLEIAIYKAGGIHESNFGDAHKMGWATSSLIHEEVSFPNEIIPPIYFLSGLRVFWRFNVEKECNMRKYCYLLPLEAIGITSNFSKAKVRHHLSEFNNILRLFEGTHPFHNYTVKPKHRKKHRANRRGKLLSESPESMFNGESESGYGEFDGEEPLQTDETVIEHVDGEHISSRYADSDELVEESVANGNGLSDPPVFAKWLHRPDEKDRVLKMVGAAVAVKRGLLPRDVIYPLSFSKLTRFVLPTAPPELLFLQWNRYALESQPNHTTRPEILTMVESEDILSNVENFYKSIMLPQFLEFLDPLKSPWKEWVEVLDASTRIPDSQLDELEKKIVPNDSQCSRATSVHTHKWIGSGHYNSNSPDTCSATLKPQSSPMATSSLRFAFSPLIHGRSSSKILFSVPNHKTTSIKILCFSSSSSSASSPLTTTLDTLAPPPSNHSVDRNTSSNKWEPFRKKKVVMRIGYVGTDYRDGTPTITRRSTPNNRNFVPRRRKKDQTTDLVAERRRKRVRRRNWWWLCSGEASKPSSLGEFLEVERRFGVEALFDGDALMDVNLGDHHRNNGRMLFADGRVLPPPHSPDDDDEGTPVCSLCRFHVLLAAICGGGGGVHSLSTMISLKMEIPEFAWTCDPNGIVLANLVNAHLPKNIRVFSILPSQSLIPPQSHLINLFGLRSFDARRECNIRKYSYLLPVEVIGITSNFSASEIEHHLSDFNDILNSFEGQHPFHNYTIRSKYRKKYSAKRSPESGRIANRRAKLSTEPPDAMADDSDGEESLGYGDGEEALGTGEMFDDEQMSLRHIDSDTELVDESDANGNSLKDLPILAKWLHEPDEKDRLSGSHFRRIFQCSCGKMEQLFGARYVEISICGESFMLHQVSNLCSYMYEFARYFQCFQNIHACCVYSF